MVDKLSTIIHYGELFSVSSFFRIKSSTKSVRLLSTNESCRFFCSLGRRFRRNRTKTIVLSWYCKNGFIQKGIHNKGWKILISWRGCLYDCAKSIRLRPIWVRREVFPWDWYDWDTGTRVWSDMTETPRSKLTEIWLRLPKFSSFLSLSQSQVCWIKKPEQFLRRLRLRLSVISVSMKSIVYKSYQWYDITANTGSSVSIVSVSRLNLASH